MTVVLGQALRAARLPARPQNACGELFTDEVDCADRGGVWSKGNQGNVERHRQIHDALAKRG